MITQNNTPSGQAASEKGAVVIGGDFQTLGVIRSLAENGVPVFQVEHEHGIARYSRYSRRRVSKTNLLDADDSVDFLLDLARRESLQGWTVFANDDETVKFLSANREELGECFRVAVPQWEIVQKVYYKQRAYEIADEIDLPIPCLYSDESLKQVLAKNPRYPLVLKPTCKENYYVKTKKKAIRVNSADELTREYNAMAELISPREIVVQEMIEGGTKNLFSFVTLFDGEVPLLGMSANRLRQHPMDFGHATTLARSVNMPELRDLATRLLAHIGYRGIAEVEFMWDERDQCYKFIEVNCRPWGWHTLAKAAGVNIPYAMHRFLLDLDVEPAEAEEDVTWIRMITDAPTVAKELVRGRLTVREYLNSLRGKKEYAVFNASDPLPSLMEYVLVPSLWWRKGF